MNDLHYYFSALLQKSEYFATAFIAWAIGHVRIYRHEIIFKLHTFFYNGIHGVRVEDWFLAFEKDKLQDVAKVTGATRAALLRVKNAGDYDIKILSEFSKNNETSLMGINTADGTKHKKFAAELQDESYMQIFDKDTQSNKGFFNLIKQYNVFTFVLSTIYVNRRSKYAIAIIVCFDGDFDKEKIDYINVAGSQMAKPAHLFR